MSEFFSVFITDKYSIELSNKIGSILTMNYQLYFKCIITQHLKQIDKV